ncbi:hypothetical protein ACPESV_31785 [Streptomyces umbrinus]
MHEANYGVYGARKVHAALLREGARRLAARSSASCTRPDRAG